MDASNIPPWTCLSTWPFNFAFAHVMAAHLAAQAAANPDPAAALSSQVHTNIACQPAPVPVKRENGSKDKVGIKKKERKKKEIRAAIPAAGQSERDV